MVVFIWLGLVCCGAANSIIWYFDEIPNAWSLVVLILCAVLILVHRYCTGTKENTRNDGDYDEDRSSIFLVSGVISIVLMVIFGILLLISIWYSAIPSYVMSSCFAGFLTVSISFALVLLRELEYD